MAVEIGILPSSSQFIPTYRRIRRVCFHATHPLSFTCVISSALALLHACTPSLSLLPWSWFYGCKIVNKTSSYFVTIFDHWRQALVIRGYGLVAKSLTGWFKLTPKAMPTSQNLTNYNSITDKSLLEFYRNYHQSKHEYSCWSNESVLRRTQWSEFHSCPTSRSSNLGFILTDQYNCLIRSQFVTSQVC